MRNRLRRQVRAHLVDRSSRTSMSGAYLVSLAAGAAAVGPHDLLADLDACLERVEQRR